MYAIVDIDGRDYKVKKDDTLVVNRLKAEEGKSVTFDQVKLVDNNGSVSVGKPLVKGAQVRGKVIGHLQGDKVIVFKKKRRQGYRVRNGHRQAQSRIQIEEIKKS